MDPVPGRPNSYVPGRARASALATTIVFRDGEPWLVLGAPGGWSVTSGILQNIVNVVDFGMSPGRGGRRTAVPQRGLAGLLRGADRTADGAGAPRPRRAAPAEPLQLPRVVLAAPDGDAHRLAATGRRRIPAPTAVRRCSRTRERCGRERVGQPARTRQPRSLACGARSGRSDAAARRRGRAGERLRADRGQAAGARPHRCPPPRRQAPDRGDPGGRVRCQPCHRARGGADARRAGARRGDEGGAGRHVRDPPEPRLRVAAPAGERRPPRRARRHHAPGAARSAPADRGAGRAARRPPP